MMYLKMIAKSICVYWSTLAMMTISSASGWIISMDTGNGWWKWSSAICLFKHIQGVHINNFSMRRESVREVDTGFHCTLYSAKNHLIKDALTRLPKKSQRNGKCVFLNRSWESFFNGLQNSYLRNTFFGAFVWMQPKHETGRSSSERTYSVRDHCNSQWYNCSSTQ